MRAFQDLNYFIIMSVRGATAFGFSILLLFITLHLSTFKISHR